MATGITVDFTANVAKFSSQVDKISGDLNKFQKQAQSVSAGINKAFATIGVGVSVAGFASIIKANIDLADHLRDLSKSTGIAVDDLAGLNLAAKQSGTDLDGLAQTVNKLSVNIGKDSEKFRELGISAKEPLDALAQLADVFVGIEDDQKRAAVAATALGKSWATAAPLLSEGGDAIRAMVADGKRLSGITDEMAEAADKFNDDLEVMKTTLAGVGASLTGPVLDGFNQLIEQIRNATKDGLSLNGVLQGIINFAIQADTSTRGLIESQREFTAKKIAAMESNGVIGGLIDDLAGNDVNLEKNRLDALNKQLADYDAKQKEVAQTAKQLQPPSSAKIDAFIGGGEGETESAKAARQAVADAQREAERAAKEAQQRYQQAQEASIDYLQQLADENALVGKSELERKQFEVTKQEALLRTAGLEESYIAQFRQNALEEIKLNDERTKSYAASQEQAEHLADLNEKFNANGLDFSRGLADVQDALNAGIIDQERAKQEFDALGKAYNEGFTDPASEATKQLSEYGQQAARNMQDSFAEFLFDPFKGGTDEMLTNFVNVIKRMVAEQAAAQLFGSKDSGGAGLGDFVSGGVKDVFGSFSGASSGISESISSGLSSFFSNLSFFEQGTNYVPNNMLAFIHKGERIIPANQNEQIGRFNNRNARQDTIRGGNSANVTVNFNGDAPTSKAAQSHLAYQIGLETQRAVNRNG